MAAGGGSPRQVADALETADPSSIPNKRMRIEVAATEVAGGSSRDIVEGKQKQQRLAAAAVGDCSSASSPSSTITNPPRLRYPPYPTSGKSEDVRTWDKECRRIDPILAKDPRNDLPTQRKPKDPDTTDAAQTPRDKAMIRRAASSIVGVSSIGHDGEKIHQCSGIIINQWEEEGKKRAIIVTCSIIVCTMGRLLDPLPKLYVCLSNMTILDGRLLFFNVHYDIALLEIIVDTPLQRPSIGSNPSYGQEVFLLTRDEELSLMARHGEILWLEESNYLGRNYNMFLDSEVPVGGDGGPVIDLDGNVIGMAFCHSPNPIVLSISTIVTCIDMWLKFSRIARPTHGLSIRTMQLLDVALQEKMSRDYGIVDNGYIVDNVSYDSTAESLGILPGDVICSIDGWHDLTLPQLEDYLLSLGWRFLQNPGSMINLKLEVYDLIRKSKRILTLPLGFCDASERVKT